jgi:hypothetical protein
MQDQDEQEISIQCSVILQIECLIEYLLLTDISHEWEKSKENEVENWQYMHVEFPKIISMNFEMINVQCPMYDDDKYDF